MKSAVRKMGNSAGVIIPKPLLAELGAATGDPVDMTIEHGKLVIAPAKRSVREGWAEASRAIAEAGDDVLLMDFANDEDEQLTW